MPPVGYRQHADERRFRFCLTSDFPEATPPPRPATQKMGLLGTLAKILKSNRRSE